MTSMNGLARVLLNLHSKSEYGENEEVKIGEAYLQ
jgi:hypothetical protein